MDLKPKNLFKRVLDFAKAEIDRRAISPSRPPPPAEPAPPALHTKPHAASGVPMAVAAPEPEPGPLPIDLASSQEGQGAPPLRAVRIDGRGLHVAWHVSDEALSDARRIAAPDAELVLRVVAFQTDAGGAIERRVLDAGASAPRGEVTFEHLDAMRVVVSVGLLSDGAFTSVTHVSLS